MAISVLQLRQRKIELADQLDDLVDRLVEADVDQQPFGAVEDQVDVAAQPLAGLVVHFDHVREDRLPLKHRRRSFLRWRWCRRIA